MGAAGTAGPLLPWRAVRVVLLSAWQARRNQGSLWPWAALLVPMVLAPALLAWFMPGERAWVLALVIDGIVAAGLLFGAWLLLAYNVLAQNHPQLAPTVPGQVRALRWVLGLGVATLGGLAALVTAAFGGPVAGLACIVAGVSTLFVCGIRWPQLWIAVAVLGWSAPLWIPSDGAKWLAAGLRALPWPVMVGAVGLAVAWALWAAVMSGGARHAHHHGRLLKVVAMMKGQPPLVAEAGMGSVGWAWALLWGRRAYAAWLMRVLGRPQPRPAALLALGQGPQLHWTGVATGVVGGWVFIALVLVVTRLFPHWDVGQGLVQGLAIGLAFASYTVLLQAPALLWAQRREQALLLLLPGTPQGPALNRWLALHLSRLHLTAVGLQWLTVWGLSTLASTTQGADWLRTMAQAALLLSPLAMLLLWRDWSTLKAPGGGAQVLVVLGALALVAAGFVWFGWLGYSVQVLAALVLALGLPLGAWRWRAIQRAPMPWPAGRS